jgi:hypothetical protein
MEELGFCADLHRPLAQAKPLTAGPSELTYLEFGSPNATLFITKTENLGENPPSALKGAARCAGTPDWYDGPVRRRPGATWAKWARRVAISGYPGRRSLVPFLWKLALFSNI